MFNHKDSTHRLSRTSYCAATYSHTLRYELTRKIIPPPPVFGEGAIIALVHVTRRSMVPFI